MRAHSDGGTGMYTVRVLIRAAGILRLLSENPQGLSLNGIAARAHLHKATAYRILVTLEQEGLVERTEIPLRYTLGLEAVAMGMKALNGETTTGRTQPILDAIAADTGEAVGTYVRRGMESVCVAYAASPYPIRYHLQVGAVSSLCVGAAGKVLLAYMPDEDIKRVIKRELALHATHQATAAKMDALVAGLESIRLRGFAVSKAELSTDEVAIAVPLRRRGQSVAAAFGLAGPVSRIPDNRIPELVSVLVAASERVDTAAAG